MSSSAELATRLDRLLSYLGHDAGNLALRRDAVRTACDSGQWEIAREIIDAGLWLHADDPELLALSGFAHLQAQSFDAAVNDLSAALACGITAPEVRYNLAFAHFMQRQYPQAAEVLSDPLVVEAVPAGLLLRARSVHHANRPEEAVADCYAYLARFPDDAEAHGLLGLILQEQKRDDEAKIHVDAALVLDSRQLEAMLALAGLYQDAGDPDSAAISLENLVAAHPHCGRGWLSLALIRLQRFETDAARQDIERATRHLPDHIGTWHVLAWTELMRGDVAAAEAAFAQAMTLDRNFAESHGGLAVVAVLQGREADARASLERALRLNRHALSARYADMLLLQRAGKHEEARRILDAILSQRAVGSDVQLRELVTKHISYLRTRGTIAPNAVLH
jgi:tetratricopeptide (TPR) repeat protein